MKSEFRLKATEVFSVLGALALVLVHLIRFAQIPELWGWPLPVLLLAALPAADFVSGFVHWFGDTWGDERTPFLGQPFIRPFRFHHAEPLNMLHSNFFTTNGDTALASLPYLAVPFAIPLDHTWGRIAAVFFCGIGVWGMWTSQFHMWAHMKSPPRVVAWLQQRRLILGPNHHWQHHKSPFTRNYCITTGWCDPILTRLRFFPTLEWGITKLTGIRPRREPLIAEGQ